MLIWLLWLNNKLMSEKERRGNKKILIYAKYLTPISQVLLKILIKKDLKKKILFLLLGNMPFN